MTQVIDCPKCGQLNTTRRSRCKSCGADLLETSSADTRPPGPPISEAERGEILAAEVAKYARRGYRVGHQTATTAQLIKPKEFDIAVAVLSLLFFGIGIIIYLLYFMAKKDETVFIEVLSDGRVSTSFSDAAPISRPAPGSIAASPYKMPPPKAR